MSVQTFLDVFNTGTGVVGTTIARTGYGFTPKVLILWWSGRTESTDAVGFFSHKRGIGFATSTTNRAVVANQAEDALATTSTDRAHREDAVVVTISTAGAISGLGDVQSLDSDGWTFIVDQQFATSVRVHVLAIGGGDIENATIVQITEPAATGDQDTTTVGFQPDVAFFISILNSTTPPDVGTSAGMMLGAADTALNNVILSNRDRNALATTDCSCYCRAGEAVAAISNSDATVVDARGTVTAWLSNGFRINWAERASGRLYWALCIKGGSWAVGSFSTIGDTVTKMVVSGKHFRPKAGLVFSAFNDGSAVDTPIADDDWSVGAFSENSPGTVTSGYQATASNDAAADAQVSAGVSHDRVYVNITESTGVVDGEMTVDAIKADGVDFLMTDAETGAPNLALYMLVGAKEPPFLGRPDAIKSSITR